MDLIQLRAFAAVAREGNLTRAAEKLHVTQPAVSLQLKALQEELQLQLFTRGGSGMTLTEHGAKLQPFAERALASAQEFRQAALALCSTVSGELAIGTILDPEFTRLGMFLKRLVESYPQLSTRLQHGMSGQVLQALRQGQLDVGFYLGELPVDCAEAIHSVTLTQFTYRVLAPAGWQQRVQGKNWEQLAQLPWIWTPPESVHSRLLLPIFEQAGVQPHQVALVDQEPSMLDLVKSGVGLSLIRESIAVREAQTHDLVIADSVSLQTGMHFICDQKRAEEPVIAAALHLIQQCWHSVPSLPDL